MNLVNCSIIALLLCAGNCSTVSPPSNRSNPISSIIQSYNNAVFDSEPSRTTPIAKAVDSTTSQPTDWGFSDRPPPTSLPPNSIDRHKHISVELKGSHSSDVPYTYDGSSGSSYSRESGSSENGSGSYEPDSGPPDHQIPYTEHENPREPATRPNYTAPGAWARPSPGKNISLDFVPSKLYAQVRGTSTVQRLPREDAIKSAETSEEKENAARLKEVVKITKANTVYSEEGYEDAGYDHAGQIRDADFHEGYAKKLEEEAERKVNGGKHGKKKKKKRLKKGRKRFRPRKSSKSRRAKSYLDDYEDHLEGSSSFESPRTTSPQRITPEQLSTLKSALSSSVLDPKKQTLDGLNELERDLKEESLEAIKATTEPYYYKTTAERFSPTSYSTEPMEARSETIEDATTVPSTTTPKRNVFTIRTRKPTTQKVYVTKFKRPSRYSVGPSNDRRYSTDSYPDQTSTTVNYGDLFWNYYKNNPNQTPAVTYQPKNGHGPYLYFVTSSSPPTPTNLFSTNQPEDDTTTHYMTVAPENLARTTVPYPYNDRNPYPSSVRDAEEYMPISPAPIDVNRRKFADDSNKANTNNLKFPRDEFEFDKSSEYPNVKDYSFMKSPINNVQRYKSTKYQNALSEHAQKQQQQQPTPSDIRWPVQAVKSERPIESGYGVIQSDERLTNEKTIMLPVTTRLLPPAPLSASEYTSFSMQQQQQQQSNRRSYTTVSPSIVTLVPIIEAIHRHKQDRMSIPFLFRKKRAAKFDDDDKDDSSKSISFEDSDFQNSKINKRSANKMYSSKFQYLLNEAPRFVNTQVDNEINKRFNNGSKEESTNDKSQESSNESSSGSGENSKHPVKYRNSNKINSGEKPSVEAEVPEFDFSNDSVEFENDQKPVRKKTKIDDNKYPFYKDSSEFRDTALKYITNPTIVPRKTFGGMEFYNSRNLECEDVNPNLDGVVPKDEDLAKKRGRVKHQNRLHGLGDKLDCYKAKYFDEDPLDNPLFHEKSVDTPSPPPELDAKQFASRISRLPGKKDEYVIPMGPKRPEQMDYTKRRRPSRNQPNRYHSRPGGSRHYSDQQRPRKPAATELFTQKTKEDSSTEKSTKKEGSNKKRQKSDKKKTRYKISPSYQRQVYEDVMGNIMLNEKLPKNVGAKRGVMHVHPKHGYREKGNSHRDNRHEVSRHHRTNNVKGPMPPKHIFDVINRKPVNPHYHKEKYVPRGTRHYYKVYKRSINSHKAQNNTIHEKAKQNVAERSPYPFRIVITTELPRTTSSNRSLTILSNESTTANPTFTIHDRLKHPRRLTNEDAKFDKFSADPTPSIDQRRNEPRYNSIQRRKMFSNPRNSTLARMINAELSNNVYQTTDASFRGSTLVPVVVRPDENFTSRIPQESKIRVRKRRPHKSSSDDRAASKSYDEVDGSGSESSAKEKDEDSKENDDPVNLDLDPDFYEHKELSDFLQGDPPGYDKAFGSGESTNKDEKKVRMKNERIDSGSHEAETNADDSSRENEKDASGEAADDYSSENSEAREADADSSKSSEKSKEPFERFSDRPYSPPENYEDEKYADLGPRINKPYFYHPPFEVPDYEKPGYDKDTHRADNFDNSQNEESEDHEKIVFPWEDDDDEDGGAEESKHFFKLGSFEYPWERRDKKEKEKRRREKLRQKSDEESDEAEEATNKRFVWVPLKRDVSEIESSYGYNPRSKFSSKYRSEIDGSLEDDDDDDNEDDEPPNIVNKDDIKESILRDIEDMESSTPKVKISQKRFQNNTVSMSKTTDDLRNPINITEFKHLTTSTTPPTTTYPKSRRGTRAPQVNGKVPSIGNNNAEKVKYTRRSYNGVSTTPASTTMKRRGRITDSVSSATNTRPVNATNPVVRRRGRLSLITTTVSPLTTTPRKIVDRRRRLFKINYNGTSASPWSNDQNNTRTTFLPTSTERTVERHSRVSKQKIITETIEHDDDDDRSNESPQDDGDNSSNKAYLTSERNRRTRNKDQEDRPKKEKVTITMEETPDHVFETKEIDRDGVKEKFVTITKNANSTGAQKSKNNFNMREEEKEERERKNDASKSFGSETGDTNSDNRPIQEAEKFVISNLMKNLPVPAKKEEKSNESENSESPEFGESEEEEDDEDYEDDDSEEGEDEEEDESEDEKDDESSTAPSAERREHEKNTNKTVVPSPTSTAHPNKTLGEKLDTKKVDNITEKSTVKIIKDPSKRKYFYVQN